MGFQSQEKYNSCSIFPYHILEIKMSLEALKQKLASLNVNPDEIRVFLIFSGSSPISKKS